MLKKTKLCYIFIFILLFHKVIVAEEQIHVIDGVKYLYKKPIFFDFMLKTPTIFTSFGCSMFNQGYTLVSLKLW